MRRVCAFTATVALLALLAAGCGGGTSEGLDASELARRAALFEESSFRALYSMSGGGGVINGTVTWYQQPGKVRGDFIGTVGGQVVDIIVIPGPGYPSETLLYVCREETASCIESRPQSEQDAYPNGEYPVVLASQLVGLEEFVEGTTVTKTSERTLVGQEVTCFTTRVEGDAADNGEACATDDGIVLSLRLEQADGPLTFEATTFSEDVDPAALALPYPLQPG